MKLEIWMRKIHTKVFQIYFSYFTFIVINTMPPFTIICFVPNMDKIVTLVLQRKISKNSHCIFWILCYHFYQKKEMALHMNITQSCFVPSLLEIGHMVLENKINIWHFMNKWTKLSWVFTSGDSKTSSGN